GVQRPEPITKVNVTPIIDVALVLVIIRLVTAPMMSVSDLPVNLPQAKTREAEDQRNVCITISSTGQLAVDDTTVGPEGLKPSLERPPAEPGNHHVPAGGRPANPAPLTRLRHTL